MLYASFAGSEAKRLDPFHSLCPWPHLAGTSPRFSLRRCGGAGRLHSPGQAGRRPWRCGPRTPSPSPASYSRHRGSRRGRWVPPSPTAPLSVRLVLTARSRLTVASGPRSFPSRGRTRGAGRRLTPVPPAALLSLPPRRRSGRGRRMSAGCPASLGGRPTPRRPRRFPTPPSERYLALTVALQLAPGALRARARGERTPAAPPPGAGRGASRGSDPCRPAPPVWQPGEPLPRPACRALPRGGAASPAAPATAAGQPHISPRAPTAATSGLGLDSAPPPAPSPPLLTAHWLESRRGAGSPRDWLEPAATQWRRR